MTTEERAGLKTSTRCRRCGSGSPGRPEVSGVPDRLHGLGGRFDYVRCADCGLLQLERTPPDLWDRHYADYRRHSAESRLYAAGRRFITGRCYPWPEGPGRLLDLGCGNGWYLKDMAARGWDVLGYEPDARHAESVSRRTGVEVVSDAESLPAGAFDLVTLNFSLEHADDPAALVALAARCAAPGGVVEVSLPDPESREARLFGRWWFHLDAPRHLVLLTRPQAAELLAAAGLEVEEVRDLGTATGFAGSLCYRLAGRFNAALWYLLIPAGLVFSALVPDGLFALTATKPPSR